VIVNVPPDRSAGVLRRSRAADTRRSISRVSASRLKPVGVFDDWHDQSAGYRRSYTDVVVGFEHDRRLLVVDDGVGLRYHFERLDPPL